MTHVPVWSSLCRAGGLMVALTIAGCSAEPRAAMVKRPATATRILGPGQVSAYLTSTLRGTLPTAIGAISPVWYTATDGGRLASGAFPLHRPPGIRLEPVISNYRDGDWDPALITRIITTPTLRATHIRTITRLVVANHFAGIDIDYELLPAADRVPFVAFIGELATALHAHGARLSLAIPAKVAASGYSAAYDYAALGRAADQLRIMTYDFSFASSSPGPVAPVWWVRRVLDYALTQAPPNKIALGIAGYGYDWHGSTGESVTAIQATMLAETMHARIHRSNGHPWFTYKKAGVRHTVWFEDAHSSAATIELARTHRVGLFLWKLGGEDRTIWTRH